VTHRYRASKYPLKFHFKLLASICTPSSSHSQLLRLIIPKFDAVQLRSER